MNYNKISQINVKINQSMTACNESNEALKYVQLI